MTKSRDLDKGLKILARIIARKYIADCLSDNTIRATTKNNRKVKGLRRTTPDDIDLGPV